MMSVFGRSVVLVMRWCLVTRNDHVETMFRLGLNIHVMTEDRAGLGDPRFASVRLLPPTLDDETLAEQIHTALVETGSDFAVTFYEVDIGPVGRANARHGVAWSRPQADETARDKARQREHLHRHGLPSPLFIGVGDANLDAVPAVLDRIGLPCVVKPTRGAGSAHVELVSDAGRARAVLADIRQLAITGQDHYYDSVPPTWALLEEYLPGEELTCDGVVVDGEFFLGGIHSKVLSHPPHFEEDLYTLPYGDPAVQAQLCQVMSRLVATLDLTVALINAELRRGSDGQFRIVEFSTRISGGHVYRNIRDAHGVDLVELFLLAAAGYPQLAAAQAGLRHPGRVATCIKFVYATGVVLANTAGAARTSRYFRDYYPIVGPGESVRGAPDGFDQCGLLSVWAPYHPAEHPAGIHRAAAECASLLDLEVRPHAVEENSERHNIAMTERPVSGLRALPAVVEVLGADMQRAHPVELAGGLTALVLEQPGRTLNISTHRRIYQALIPVTTSSFAADMTPYWAQRSKEGYLERLAEFVLVMDTDGRMVGWTGYHILPHDEHTIVYLDSTGMVPERQSKGVMRRLMQDRIAVGLRTRCPADRPVFLTARSESPIFYRLMRGLLPDGELFPHVGVPAPEPVRRCAVHLAEWLGQRHILEPATLTLRGAYEAVDELYGELPTTGDAELDELFRGQLGPLDAYLLIGSVSRLDVELSGSGVAAPAVRAR